MVTVLVLTLFVIVSLVAIWLAIRYDKRKVDSTKRYPTAAEISEMPAEEYRRRRPQLLAQINRDIEKYKPKD